MNMVSVNFQMTGPAIGGTEKTLISQVAGADKKRQRRQQDAAVSTTPGSSAFGSPKPAAQDGPREQLQNGNTLAADPPDEGESLDETDHQPGASVASLDLATEAQEYEDALPAIENDLLGGSVVKQAEGSVAASNISMQDQRAMDGRSDQDAGAVTLDPKASPRQYVHDPYTAVQREVWRPGDGDGDPNGDYSGRPGGSVNLSLHKRWRFYQSSPESGPWRKKNMPPRFVVLDDRAAFEVFKSEIAKHNLPKWWSHDFAGQGRLIKHRRVHRGRPAVAHPNMLGDDRYHSAPSRDVKKPEMYYFTGQQDYTPIIYRDAEFAGSVKKRKASLPARKEPVLKKQHNQFTPYEDLVKNGAPSTAKSRNTNKAKLERFLKRPPSPRWEENPASVHTGVADQARALTASGDDVVVHFLRFPTLTAHVPLNTTAQRRGRLANHDNEQDGAGQAEITQALLDSQLTQTGEAVHACNTATDGATEESDDDGEEDFLFPGKQVVNRLLKPSATAYRRHDELAKASPSTQQSGNDRVATSPRAKTSTAIITDHGVMEEISDDLGGGTAPISTAKDHDTGSYAAELEEQLVKAEAKIAELTTAREAARLRIGRLEGAIQHLRPSDVGEGSKALGPMGP